MTGDVDRVVESVVDHVEALTGLSELGLHRIFWSLVSLGVILFIRGVWTRIIDHRVTDVSKRYLATKTVGYVLGIVFLLVLIRIWFGGGGKLVAYFGILSAGLAIALQDPLTNLAGWLFITIRKPFIVGDRIQIGEHRGDVIDVRPFQFSMVEIGNWVDADQSTGRIIHVPNGQIFKLPQANYTQGFNFIWDELPVMVTFESDWKKAKEILTGIVEKHSALQSQHAEQEVRKAARKYLIFFQKLSPIVWTSVADSGVVLTMRYLCEPRKRRSVSTAIWEEVLEQFAACPEIDFAYPTTRFYDNRSEGKPEARAD
ncbi:MAG: mechanosensitive ion channel [Kiritimatiellae bacterium]|nr:mechanosensitive ion channel [Kiritimatiellia bacterium]